VFSADRCSGHFPVATSDLTCSTIDVATSEANALSAASLAESEAGRSLISTIDRRVVARRNEILPTHGIYSPGREPPW